MAKRIELRAEGVTHEGRELITIKEASLDEYSDIIQRITDKAFAAIGFKGQDDETH